MWKLLTPPAYKTEQTGPEADARYKQLRWQVFLGIFIGYAGFYVVGDGGYFYALYDCADSMDWCRA